MYAPECSRNYISGYVDRTKSGLDLNFINNIIIYILNTRFMTMTGIQASNKNHLMEYRVYLLVISIAGGIFDPLFQSLFNMRLLRMT